MISSWYVDVVFLQIPDLFPSFFLPLSLPPSSVYHIYEQHSRPAADKSGWKGAPRPTHPTTGKEFAFGRGLKKKKKNPS